MTRRDEVQALLDRGLNQRAAAAELGISPARVSRLLSGKTGNEHRDATTQQPAGTSPDATLTQPHDATPGRNDATLTQPHDATPGRNDATSDATLNTAQADATTQPVFVQPGTVTANTVQQLTAERDELRAKMTALRPQWDALQAENRTLREQLSAANEELREAAPAASSGTCRQHGTALIPLCPRCQGLDPDA